MTPSASASAVAPDLRGSQAQYRSVLFYMVAALWLVFAFYIRLCLQQTGGHYTNPSDDVYISMTLAKNLAQNGTWGLQPGHFASVASSPAWVCLMALIFRFAGPAEWVPLAMNIASATLLFVVIWAVLRSLRVPPGGVLLGLLLVLVLTPLVPVAFLGLEHVLQAAIDLAFVFAVATDLANDAPAAGKRPALAALLLLSPLLTFVRYEGMFFIGGAAALLLARKRWKEAALIGVLGMSPIVVSGLIFVHKGWFFLPTSLLQKANMPRPDEPFEYLTRLLTAIPTSLHATGVHGSGGAHLAVLVGLVLLAWLCAGAPVVSSRAGVMTMLFLAATFFHLEVARLGSFYRYEACLMCLGLVLLVVLAAQWRWRPLLEARGGPKWARLSCLVIAAALVGEPLLDRACGAYAEVPIASRNVWEQQYQMGRFLHTYYEGASVAANDIGAINFFAGIQCTDVTGLGDNTVMRMLIDKEYNRDSFVRLLNGRSVKIALVYESWAKLWGGIPPTWVKAGDWTILDNVVCGAPIVSFFAVDPAEAPALRDHLRDFFPKLPDSVYVRITPE